LEVTNFKKKNLSGFHENAHSHILTWELIHGNKESYQKLLYFQ